MLAVRVMVGIAFLCALFFFIIKPERQIQPPIQILPVIEVQKTLAEEPIVSEFDEITTQTLARLISRHHYLQPDYGLVLPHVVSRNSTQKYLRTLDAYSRIASADEMTFAKMRSQPVRVGPGVDYLFAGDEVVIFPVHGAELYNSGVKTAALLESINDRQLDISNFQSYAFLGAIDENETINIKIVTPQQPDAQLISIASKTYENKPVRYYQSGEALILEIRQFRSGYTGVVRSAITAAQNSKLFVIDLRYSPGGDIYAMTDWLSLLLPENQLLSLLQTKRYERPTELRTLSGQIALKTPIAILISHYTASSAEIFARILESSFRERSQLIGEPTKGKCLAQKSYVVNDENSIVLSTNEVLLADGESCNGKKLNAEVELQDIEFKSMDEVLLKLQ